MVSIFERPDNVGVRASAVVVASFAWWGWDVWSGLRGTYSRENYHDGGASETSTPEMGTLWPVGGFFYL